MKLPSRLTVLTATLLVLLPALAILQYRWVGQLGDAARERMQRNLHNAAQQFRESFDMELARAVLSLQVDSLSRDRYAERYAAWASTTAYPWLVADVYLVEASGRDLRLQRWDGQTRAFVPALWEGPLAAARARFATELDAFLSGEPRRLERGSFQGYEDLLVAPLIHVQFGPAAPHQILASTERVFGFTVIHLNTTAIRDQLLPALAHRHFSQSDDDSYRVAVIEAANPSRVLYKSSPDATTDAARADVTVPLFGRLHDPMMFLAGGGARDLGDIGDKRRLVFSVIREQRDDRVTVRSRVSSADEGRWRLLAQHQRGSLEAAVGDVRQRNLLISFGILLLMGVSIGLLTLSSRHAQRLAQQRMEFVAGVSHELRTPVAVIRSAAENLSHGVVGDADHARRYGDAIQIEARRLGEMVERVLHFAGIESGRVLRTPIAVEPLIQEAISAAVPQGANGFIVERHIPPDLPPVQGDAAAIRSAIQNLVANAVKYGGPDRWIRVRAESGRQKRDSSAMAGDRRMTLVSRERGPKTNDVRITVEDRGAGIAPADLPHIFDAFYRGANATNQQIQGSGLGLALVQAVTKAHGGCVSVSTREGAGSIFTLHLPVAPTTKAVPLQSPNEAAAG